MRLCVSAWLLKAPLPRRLSSWRLKWPACLGPLWPLDTAILCWALGVAEPSATPQRWSQGLLPQYSAQRRLKVPLTAWFSPFPTTSSVAPSRLLSSNRGAHGYSPAYHRMLRGKHVKFSTSPQLWSCMLHVRWLTET